MGGALYNLFEFLKEYKIDRCASSKDVHTADIVACFDGKTLVGLGKVIYVGHQDLVQDHEDGPHGEVFVLPYNKAKVRNVPLNRK